VQLDEILGEVAALQKQRYDNYITVNGMRIRYTVMGNGPAVLMLHCFGGFLETWAYNVPPLSRRFLVYAVDLPGHGLSDKPRVDYTMGFVTECAAALLRAFGIERMSLIGHSMGGAIAISIALEMPDTVNRLVLVDSAGLTSQLPLAYRLTSRPLAGEMIAHMVTRASLRHGLQSIFYNPKVLTEEMLDLAFTNACRPGVKKTLLRILRNYLSLAGPRPEAILTRRLPELRMPILFIHGTHDRIFPLRQVRKAFTLAPNAEVKIMSRCGHCPQIERPVLFNETVTDFLEGNY
jgi:pimeloyl-ACP methyl ester carboxylesterase